MQVERKSYSAFTLVEMLIVMGILAILMTIGIAVGRFAIQRANNIQHQSAADQLFQSLQSYYTDNRAYPPTSGTGALTSFTAATASSGILGKYIDSSFDGGSPASYTYMVSSDRQSVLVCVSLGGQTDTSNLGYYCSGNGYSNSTMPVSIPTKSIPYAASGTYTTLDAWVGSPSGSGNVTQWSGTAWQ